MLFIAIQPAHLQKVKHQDLSPDDRDVVRADLLRGFMKSCTSDQPTA
jgi:protein-arginine kinase